VNHLKPLRLPDYNNSIWNVSSSILAHYGAATTGPTNAILDQKLAKGQRNVVLILVDALGDAMLKKHLSREFRLVLDKKAVITSVFPSTTVAATTSVLAGKTPLETGWLGWSQYFRKESRSVITFTGIDYYDDTKIDHPVAEAVIPYVTLYDQIKNAAPDVTTTEVFPAFRTPENDTFAKICDGVRKACKTPGRNFVYAYWEKVDSLAHEFGPGSIEVNAMIRDVDSEYGKLCDDLGEDATIIVIADHGQVDVCPIILDDYPDLMALCEHLPSMETRAAAFFVKPDQKETFERLFNRYFRDYFVLYPSQKLVAMGFFGPGKKHPEFDYFIGDFIAVAIDHYFFAFRRMPVYFRGQHAGIVAEEMLVPLIIHSH